MEPRPLAIVSSHVGRRPRNEDSYGIEVRLGVYAVADGMGGHRGGQVASRLAVRGILSYFEGLAATRPSLWRPRRVERERVGVRHLQQAFARADEFVCSERERTSSDMGTTLAVLVLGAGQGVIGHTGDSRVYRLRQGQLELLTPDHTFAAALEAAGLPKGAIEMFGHMLTRAIGLPGNATPDIISVDVESDDLFLLCSDGLTKVLDDEELASVLTEREPLRVGNALIEKALRQGGDDNITTLLVWPDAPPGLPSRAASAA